MHFTADTLDDLLRDVLTELIKSTHVVTPTKGATKEYTGVLLELRNPRARLSRTERKGTVFSCLGELMWYLAGSDELAFMTYYVPGYGEYSDDGQTVHGAYGPRLFGMHGVNQIENVAALLKANPNSRRAVIQLFDASDLTKRFADVPCTCTIQFLARDGDLQAVVYMRSNDAYLGLPHDIFCFTMLQEMLARRLGLDVGVYKHCVGSLHMYDEHLAEVQQYLTEGYQPTLSVAMPPMPLGDPRPAISRVLEAETAIRAGTATPDLTRLDPYWCDLIRLLRIFASAKRDDWLGMEQLKSQMASRLYDSYVLRRQDRAQAKANQQSEASKILEGGDVGSASEEST
jgi:thymidylate synthase